MSRRNNSRATQFAKLHYDRTQLRKLDSLLLTKLADKLRLNRIDVLADAIRHYAKLHGVKLEEEIERLYSLPPDKPQK